MAERLLKHKKQRPVAQKGGAVAGDPAAALVCTYKEKQLAWIKQQGVYNYPVKDGDELTDEACGKIKELWLYADAKGTRHVFAAAFVGKMTSEAFLAANPTYAKFSFIDLFAGIGGFRLAMRNCGGESVFSSEFDPYAQKTYETNFAEVPAGDITKQETHDLIPERRQKWRLSA